MGTQKKNDWDNNLHLRFYIWLCYKLRLDNPKYEEYITERADRYYWRTYKVLSILCGIGALCVVYPHLTLTKFIIVVVLGFLSTFCIYKLGYDDGIEYSILDFKRDYIDMRKQSFKDAQKAIDNQDITKNLMAKDDLI